jgi:hypothetical protein
MFVIVPLQGLQRHEIGDVLVGATHVALVVVGLQIEILLPRCPAGPQVHRADVGDNDVQTAELLRRLRDPVLDLGVACDIDRRAAGGNAYGLQ